MSFDSCAKCGLPRGGGSEHLERVNSLPLKRYCRSVLLCGLAGVLSACATHQKLSPADRQGLRTVSVAKVGQYPKLEQVYVQTLGQTLGMAVGGVVGVAAAVNSAKSDREVLHSKLLQERIDPGVILAEEFEKKLVASRLFSVTRPPADAEFRLQVKMVGLASRGTFTLDLMPVLTAEATLVRRNGSVIWQKSAAVFPASAEYEGYRWSEFLQNPDRLRGSFRQAGELLADKLAVDLGAESAEDAEYRLKDEAREADYQRRKEEKAERRAARRR